MKRNILISSLVIISIIIAARLLSMPVKVAVEPVPTVIPVETYKHMVLGWLTDVKYVNATVLRVLNGNHVSDVELESAGVTLAIVQRELHMAVPPQPYAKMHAQLTGAVDLYVDGLQDYANGDVVAAVNKMNRAAAMFGTLKDLIPPTEVQI